MSLHTSPVSADYPKPIQNLESHSLFQSLCAAYQAAKKAGEYIQSKWDTDFKIEYKGTVDLVGEVDLGAQTHTTLAKKIILRQARTKP